MPDIPPIVDARVRLPCDRRPAFDLAAPYFDRYDQVLNVRNTASATTDDLLAEMDRAGVVRAIVHAEYEHGDPADALNEAVAALVDEYPDRFWGYGAVSLEPLRISRALAQIERVVELGLVGVNVQPVFYSLPLDERRLYPIYARAEELGLPVAVHCGVNYGRWAPLRLERPELLDQVACDFPDLRLIACHGGWPWAAELAAVVRRHPSVYLDFGGLAPKYVGRAGSGWDPLLQYMRGDLIADQALMASDWPVFPMQRAVDEWRQIDMAPHVLERLLGVNALRLHARDHDAVASASAP